MTDRHTAYVVTLDEAIREDDAQHIINALRMVRGVLDVEPVVSDALAEHAATLRTKQLAQRKIMDAVKAIWEDE